MNESMVGEKERRIALLSLMKEETASLGISVEILQDESGFSKSDNPEKGIATGIWVLQKNILLSFDILQQIQCEWGISDEEIERYRQGK